MALINNKNFGIRKQMILSMLIILGIASANSWIGVIPHLLTAIWVAYLSDSVIKYIKNKRIYFNETALITGMIVAAVIDPNTPLLLTGLISLVWIISKNFVTINKRHIFNPAAFWIVTIWLLFPSIFQSWWIWSQVIPIIILWILLNYRLWRIWLLLSYLATLFILKTVFDYFSWNSLNLLDFWNLISTFFIFFMLIEPQTSPSMKHKKIIFGILAAIYSFLLLNLPMPSIIAQNWILIWLLVANLYFNLSQMYKDSQTKIITNFIIVSIFLSLLSCTNNKNDTTLNNIATETGSINNMINNIDSNSWAINNNTTSTGSKIIKLDKLYMSPGWNDDVIFNISTENNLITNVEVVVTNANRTSKKYIDKFNQNINTALKWKTIKEAKNINTIWWASLTTNAFKDIIKDI